MPRFSRVERIMRNIIQPTLEHLGDKNPRDAMSLLTGIGIMESLFLHDAQFNGGPALSWWQIEPDTLADLSLYIARKPNLRPRVYDLMSVPYLPCAPLVMLQFNPWYACAMARVFWLRKLDPLPAYNGLASQAEAWKKHYNTSRGRGTVDGYRSTVGPEFPMICEVTKDIYPDAS